MNLLKNVKIRNKLIIGFAINILFMIVIGIISFNSVHKIQHNLEDIFEVRLPSVSFLLEADRDLHQSLIAERTLLFTEPGSIAVPALVEAFNDNKAQTFQRYEKYAALITNQQERTLVPQFKKAYSTWEQSAKNVIELGQDSASESRIQAIEASVGDVSAQFDTMRGFIDRATELNMKDADKAHQESVAVFKATIALLLGALIISLGVSVFLAWYIAKSITNPLSHAIEGLKEVAQGQGDLTKRLTASGKDEVGDLTHWFNAFIGNLQSIILRVAENTTATSEASSQLLRIAEQISGNATNLAQSSSSVSNSSEELSASIATIASAVEEYSSNINVVASAAEELNSSVVEISKSTSHANQMTAESVNEASITTEKMQILEQAAKEITNVTEVINSISKQTNLLALNATIEAASAGEAGKGFAVVANEIKELARQTSDATSEIQTQIDSIQSSSASTLGQITKITEIIRDVDSAVTTIAAAVEEQSVTTQEISGNITQASDGINEVAENVGKGAQSTAAIAEEIKGVDNLVGNVNDMSHELQTNANRLKTSSSDLSELVQRFKIA